MTFRIFIKCVRACSNYARSTLHKMLACLFYPLISGVMIIVGQITGELDLHPLPFGMVLLLIFCLAAIPIWSIWDDYKALDGRNFGMSDQEYRIVSNIIKQNRR